MAGRAFIESQETWRAMIAAPYNHVNPECQTCRAAETTNKKCVHNFFCVDCKQGNLRRAAFRNGGAHDDHSSIQVWFVSRARGVDHHDLRRFIPKELVDQIQLYRQNTYQICKFFKPERATNSTSASGSSRRLCHGCHNPISEGGIHNRSRRPVCSVECLLDHALAPRVDFLIAAIDSMPGDEWALITPPNDNNNNN